MSPTRSGAGSYVAPTDVLNDAIKRLRYFSYFVASAHALYFVLFFTVWSEHNYLWGALGSGIILVLSLLFGVWLRKPRPASRYIPLAFTYELLLCLQIATTEYVRLRAGDTPVDQISWTCMFIILFPVFIPVGPRRIVLASLLAAAMNPLGYLIGEQSMLFGPASATTLASLFFPPLVCALAAWIPARALSSMGQRVNRARRLGSYELVERLGMGGMGEVWRAKHRLLARPAAIKLIRMAKAVTADATAATRERFEREAQITANLESPHTVSLYDFGVAEDGTFYYVMELLRGQDLESLIRDNGPLPAERAIHLLIQATESLQEAHSHGLIHRDVKPANIWVGPRAGHHDFVKVLDFGLVKVGALAVTGDDVQLTQEGQLTGTPAYLAPELATGERFIDARADIYALGCVAYYLITGRLVFDSASTPIKMVIAHATETPKAPSQITEAAVPEQLDTLIMDCLAKEPAGRPASCAVVRELLQAVPLEHPWTDARAERWWTKHRPNAT
ncbi:MAG: tRNA A-37 threonylcarbamoyl transferase component Bud32 [Myxococcota bacterium]|jgi:tRNA A-37 threonylcarbamoyl transferase component Bud32